MVSGTINAMRAYKHSKQSPSLQNFVREQFAAYVLMLNKRRAAKNAYLPNRAETSKKKRVTVRLVGMVSEKFLVTFHGNPRNNFILNEPRWLEKQYSIKLSRENWPTMKDWKTMCLMLPSCDYFREF